MVVCSWEGGARTGRFGHRQDWLPSACPRALSTSTFQASEMSFRLLSESSTQHRLKEVVDSWG
eukprot:2012282-Amphidinium_carterae.1